MSSLARTALTVSAAAALAAPAKSVPIRHGSARLQLVINGQVYALKSIVRPGRRGARSWSLTHRGGPRAGVSHVVTKVDHSIACTCEDSFYHGSWCKHMRALVAVGLLSPRSVPFAGSKALNLFAAPATSAVKGGA